MGKIMCDAVRVKITRDGKSYPTSSGKLFAMAQGQIGFKSNDGTWTNEWVTLKSARSSASILGILKKGETVEVTGRLLATTFTSKDGEAKKQWEIWVDTIGGDTIPADTSAQTVADMDEVPF